MPKCCATDCENEGVYKFPKVPTQRELWEKALRIPDFKAQKSSSLCPKHFREEDYYFGGKSSYDYYSCVTKTLKRTTVPSLFHYNNYKIKPDNPDIKLKTKQLISHAKSEAFSEDRSNSTAQMPFPQIIKVTSLKNLLPYNEGYDEHIKSEIKYRNQTNETICRTCLTENATIPLTEISEDGCTLGAMLNKIADVSVETGLSNVICTTCKEDLRFSIAFRRRARLADKTLRSRSIYSSFSDDAAFTSSSKVKHDHHYCKLFEGFETIVPDIASTFDSDTTVNVIKKESEYAASPDHSIFKMDHDHDTNLTSQQPADVPYETFNDTVVKKMRELMEHQETNTEIKPTHKVLKLKAIDRRQIPVEMRKTIKAYKLVPYTPAKVNIPLMTNVCEVCGIIIISNNHLYRHTEMMHPGVKPFKCTSCNECFRSPNAIKYHKSFACDQTKHGANELYGS